MTEEEPGGRGERGQAGPTDRLEELEERLDELERRLDHQDVRQVIMEVRRDLSMLERKLELVVEFLGPDAEPIKEGKPARPSGEG